MKKIILIGPIPPPYNGQSVSFKMLIGAISNKFSNFAVVNISPENEFPRKFEKLIRISEYLKVLYRFVASFKFKKSIVYITISQAKPGFFRDAAIIWLARITKTRIITHVKGGYYDGLYKSLPFCFKKFLSVTLCQVDAIIVLSENLKAMFDFNKSLAPKLCVVPNGLPISKDNLPPEPKSISEGAAIRILYLSNLIESKGYLDVLKAVDILRNRWKLNIKCNFCGEFKTNEDDITIQSSDHAKKIFFDFIDANGLAEYVKYIGNVAGVQKNNELREAHFFILPTNFNKEGQPVSIIEAMAFGCVIISTKYRAIPSMVIEDYNGLFVEYGAPEQIAGAVTDISSNAQKFRQMSRNSIDFYNREFTQEKHLKQIIPIITGDKA